jgi:hypothetical protein
MDFTYDIQARAVGSGCRARWRSCLGRYGARTVPKHEPPRAGKGSRGGSSCKLQMGLSALTDLYSAFSPVSGSTHRDPRVGPRGTFGFPACS